MGFNMICGFADTVKDGVKAFYSLSKMATFSMFKS